MWNTECLYLFLIGEDHNIHQKATSDKYPATITTVQLQEQASRSQNQFDWKAEASVVWNYAKW